jgi:hypothetical protein
MSGATESGKRNEPARRGELRMLNDRQPASRDTTARNALDAIAASKAWE